MGGNPPQEPSEHVVLLHDVFAEPPLAGSFPKLDESDHGTRAISTLTMRRQRRRSLPLWAPFGHLIRQEAGQEIVTDDAEGRMVAEEPRHADRQRVDEPRVLLRVSVEETAVGTDGWLARVPHAGRHAAQEEALLELVAVQPPLSGQLSFQGDQLTQ